MMKETSRKMHEMWYFPLFIILLLMIQLTKVVVILKLADSLYRHIMENEEHGARSENQVTVNEFLI